MFQCLPSAHGNATKHQGDNLLLARVNLLLTYAEHLQARWQRKPAKEELQAIATIISWNLWQMDGLHLSVPGGKPQPETEQLDLFSMFGAAEPQPPTVSCKVKNWRKGSHGTAQNLSNPLPPEYHFAGIIKQIAPGCVVLIASIKRL